VIAIDFALGFIAGEGSFTTSRTWAKGKPYVRPVFHVQLDNDDAYLLTEVRESFANIGEITERDGVIRWEVGSEEDLQKLIKRIDEAAGGPWLASQKREAYQTWKKVVEVYAGGPCDDQDRVDMATTARDGELNVGSGGTDADYQTIIDWYAENRNVYPTAPRN